MAQAIDIPPPPRATGQSSDARALLEWTWEFYKAVIVAGGLLQTSALPAELAAIGGHNALTGLQGGSATPSERYHLTQAQHTLLTSAVAANRVFAGPTSGAAAIPTFRALTLASADFANQGTTTTVLHGNAAGNPSFSQVNLTTTTTGTLPATRGGTGLTTYAQGDLIYASAIDTLAALAIGGSAGQMLRSTGTLPAWSTTTWPNTLTANQVLYGTGTNAVGASANLTFDGTTLALTGSETISSNLTVTGNQAIGTTVNTNYALNVQKVLSTNQAAAMFALGNHTSAQTAVYGLYGKSRVNHTSGTVTNNIGLLGLSEHAAKANVTNQFAGYFQNYFIFPDTTGTVSNSYGFYVDSVGNSMSGAASVTVNNQFGFYVADQSANAAANLSFGNVYGLYVTKPSAGTARYAGVFTDGPVGIGQLTPSAILHLKAGTATANTAPMQVNVGTSETVARSGLLQFSSASASGIQAPNGSRWTVTESDLTERYLLQAASSAKTVAGAPYANDGYVTVMINGTAVRLMTTA